MAVIDMGNEARPGSRAVAKYVRSSAFKAREVLDLVRGKSYAEAREILTFSERRISDTIAKCLDSAVANAEHNDDLDGDELFVAACYADEGPTLKRWRPRARGRATRIRKRTCHITMVVARYTDEELAAIDARATLKGTGRRSSPAEARRRRVAASRERDAQRAEAEAEDHEHDDDLDADDDVETTEEIAAEGTDDVADEADDGEAETTDQTDDEPEATAEADEAEADAESADEPEATAQSDEADDGEAETTDQTDDAGESDDEKES
ncbi:50S ribosomal protein L22 [Candidatus Poriferisocius sp.]|uniref:50S ribosomal protein L22 n=1 Tax=Candidatus Poriferisocius sp. TaxID=3101276 RepID=UPI003B5C4FE2